MNFPTTKETAHYLDSPQHLLAELERIDLLVQIQVRRVRQLHKADEQFAGLVISEQEVDDLLARPIGMPRFLTAQDPEELQELQYALAIVTQQVEIRKNEGLRRGIRLRLLELQNLFGLDSFDLDCLLICLAPELDLRYERLYGYLQDDVTKKRPTVDLVLNLLCASFQERLNHRQRFASAAPLMDRRLVHIYEDPSHPQATLLSKYLRIDERVTSFLLGSNEMDPHLPQFVRHVRPKVSFDDLILPSEMKRRLMLVAERGKPNGIVLYFQGSYGFGRRSTAEALCRNLDFELLLVDVEALLSSQAMPFEEVVRLIEREAVLQGAVLYWDNFDVCLAEDKRLVRAMLLSRVNETPGITFLSGSTAWEPTDEPGQLPFVRVEFPRPTYQDRVQHWKRSLAADLSSEIEPPALANRFRFSGGQIKDVTSSARNLSHWRDPENGHITMPELYEACRMHASRKLSTLGRKIKPRHTWNDVVLPEDKLEQLKEICDSIKFRSLVYDKWGFDRKLSLGKGLNILFAGPSGTGKTMCAEVMARELGLDLYKIDLSTVVSKYIGETEKNLSRIFAEAESSEAILFFDEADALFGKRSEVRDSHDRYANIEINYLLQKMEEHEGVVILATNFRKNMDDAFVRRMHHTVEFSFPSEADRRRIWEKIWPAEIPDTAGLDLDFMARRFEIAGGNIRNIAVAAAFLAASDGGVIKMAHLLHGTRREYQKMGKVVMQGEFE